MADLVKIVSGQGMWYEEIPQEKAERLNRAFGSNFDVTIEQLMDALEQTELPLGTTVDPDSLQPDDRILGTCYL